MAKNKNFIYNRKVTKIWQKKKKSKIIYELEEILKFRKIFELEKKINKIMKNLKFISIKKKIDLNKSKIIH